jgi:DNA processing protein
LIALHLMPSLGPVRISRLIRVFGSARAAANAADEDLAAVPGIGPRLAARLVGKRASLDAAEELRRAAAVGARVLTWLDAGYPARLRDLQDAPPVVYLRGAWDGSFEPAVAIVGTRRPSAYGLDVAGGLGEALGEAGVVVISGLARGIDRAAHAGALRRGGKTVAVLGCGVDIVYPREHRTLMEAMLSRGGVVSEAPMGVRPERQRFPLRNRLISGMAQAVVVVEGAVDSGSLITARHARDQQREVYAVPGSVFAPESRGPHHLLTEGARVLRDPAELLERLGIVHPPRAAETSLDPLSEEEARVVAALGEAAVHIDGIIERSGLGAGRVAAALATLEVRGIVRQCPGKWFAKRSGFREAVEEPAGGDRWPNLLSS